MKFCQLCVVDFAELERPLFFAAFIEGVMACNHCADRLGVEHWSPEELYEHWKLMFPELIYND